jgi:hypothetical protein
MKIDNYTEKEQLELLKDICNRIYIARNISMSQESIIIELTMIDSLFREQKNFN